ncbi:InlB B-repeat-containing protein [Varibaculum vaginae]|uniref:InlB B-repeat-containing protein n=1 Tax=Varibaculum vaginae TaxID=2364797 RepID=UPI000F07C221|nr:InlB B-repeat-containing protein [Varibaculum vaginae]
MNENKRSIRLLALIVATLFAMTSLFFTGSTGKAWAQDPAENKHITAVQFSLFDYEFGKTPNGVQVASQTDNVGVESKRILQADPNANAWKDATGTFAHDFKYRVKIGFTATKAGYDFNGLTQDHIKLETGETAAEYDPVNKIATFDLNRIPANHTLTFETNGGTPIAAVTKPLNTVIDLTQYAPTKAGFKFAGWYGKPELTQKMDEVTLGQDTTVYAKWTKDETATPEDPQPEQPADSDNQPAPLPAPEPAPAPQTTPTPQSSANNRNTSAKAAESKGGETAKKNHQEVAETPVTGSHSLLAIPMSVLMTAAGAALVASRRRNASI